MVKRLAYLCGDPGIAPDGHKGASVHFREMARALRSNGVEVDAIMARELVGVGESLPGVRIVSPKKSAGATRELRSLANSMAMCDALLASNPHDAVYERLSLFGLAGLGYAKLTGIPWIVEVNAPLWEEAAKFRSLHLVRSARAMALDVLNSANHVVVVSKVLRQILVDEGIHSNKISVLGNGARLDLFEAASPRARPSVFEGKRVLVFVGSLKAWHGIEFLLDAFADCCARLPLGLWIVGDGPLRDVVHAAQQRFPQAIVVEGNVSHERIPEILKAADIAVAPYLADAPSYFCPLKVVEALAAQCSLLASRTPCVTEVTDDDTCVRLFKPGDRADFARCLEELLEDNGKAPCRSRSDLAWTTKASHVTNLLGWQPVDDWSLPC